jgi:hypothetical protein
VTLRWLVERNQPTGKTIPVSADGHFKEMPAGS